VVVVVVLMMMMMMNFHIADSAVLSLADVWTYPTVMQVQPSVWHLLRS
jgi:hypothetical protein